MTVKLFAATLPDHSHTDADALEWGGDCCFELESKPVQVSSAGWRRVGDADNGSVVVWHDGCESYAFEDRYVD